MKICQSSNTQLSVTTAAMKKPWALWTPWRSQGLSEGHEEARGSLNAMKKPGALWTPSYHCFRTFEPASLCFLTPWVPVDVCVPNSCVKSSRMPKALLRTHKDGYCQKPNKQTKSKEQVLVRMRRKWNTWGTLTGTSTWHSHSGIQDGGSLQLGRRPKELKQNFSQYV